MPARVRDWRFAIALVVGCSGDDGGVGASASADAGDETTASPTTSSSTSGTSESGAGSGDASTMWYEPLVVDCASPPMGAVGAGYSHTFTASGGEGSVWWEFDDVPAGLTASQGGGNVYGKFAAEGSYDLTVTAHDEIGSSTEICTIEVGAALSIDLAALGKPCIEVGDDISMYTSGGDGAALTCTTLNGSGNGKVPDGIVVDSRSCMIEGEIVDGYGTWAWITAVEQSNYRVYVPYCATKDVLPDGWYTVEGDHSGEIGNVLAPKVGTFVPGEPVVWGGGGDPVIRVTGGCGPNACYYGYAFTVHASPFDDHSLAPAMAIDDIDGNTIGFSHELSATGPAVASEFEARPWVLSWNLNYCIAADAETCGNAEAIVANGTGGLRFATIMLPP